MCVSDGCDKVPGVLIFPLSSKDRSKTAVNLPEDARPLLWLTGN